MEGGRRTASHEFPFRDDPYVEDLGGKQKTFTVEAFVIGDDYFVKRDALLDALDKEGPGTLVHPYFGEKTLQVDTYRLRETMNDGRMASFSITFKQTGRINYPVTSLNKTTDVTEAVTAANEAAANALAAAVDVGDGRVASAMETSVAGVVSSIKKGLAAAMSKAAKIRGAFDQLDRWTRDVSRMATAVATYARKPLELYYNMQSAVERLANVTDNARDAVRAYQRLFNNIKADFASKEYRSTPRGVQARVNDRALLLATTVAIAGSASKAAAVADYETKEDADTVRDGILAMLDDVLFGTTDDDLYNRVMDLRVALSGAVPPDTASIRRISTKTLPESTPALVLSFRIYGTVDFADEIVQRNKVRHPGAVPGGVELEVLT